MRLLPPPPGVGTVVCAGGREVLQLTISKQHRLSRLKNFPHDQNCLRDKPNQFIFFSVFDLASYQLSVVVGAGFDQKFSVLAVSLFAKPARTGVREVVGAGFDQKFSVLAVSLFAKPARTGVRKQRPSSHAPRTTHHCLNQ
ncbi:hypothetical protein [Scytonema millei]|uniref:hypothetical protein n=1 Tax=Scytonema millei TaxID=1245922 RepID=UPI002573ECE6|nr:hypothetical protein [Scytonema millei]